MYGLTIPPLSSGRKTIFVCAAADFIFAEVILSAVKTKIAPEKVYDVLFARWGRLRCALNFADPYQLLVAVVLSAQCRDDRVNQTTPEFFRRWPDAAALAGAEPEEVAEVIRNCGLFRSKAEHLTAAAAAIVSRFGGRVPETMEELTDLPGIGRKSANVLLGDAFDKPGFPVDTHVRRVLGRIGVTRSGDPERIEAEVCAELPPEKWSNFSHLVIRLGREICHARKPGCGACPLQHMCVKNL